MKKLATLIFLLGILALALGNARAALVSSQDLGTASDPSVPGSFTYDAATGTYAVTGSGSDVYGNDDNGHFVYEQVNSDYIRITARAVSIEGGTHAWAKLGVMIRDTLNADSVNAALAKGRTNPFNDQRRTTVRDSTGRTNPRPGPGNVAENFPYWMRLTRDGDQYSYALSEDGVDWFEYPDSSTATIATTGSVYVGLFITSHANGDLSTGTFDNLDIFSMGTAVTWDGTDNNDWDDSTHWVGGVVPDRSSPVQVPGGILNVTSQTAAAISLAVQAGEIAIGDAAKLSVGDRGVQLAPGSSLSLGNGGALSTSSRGDIEALGATIDIGSNASVTAGGTLLASGPVTLAEGASVTSGDSGAIGVLIATGNATLGVNDGRMVITSGYKNDLNIESVRAFATGGEAKLVSLEVNEIDARWGGR